MNESLGDGEPLEAARDLTSVPTVSFVVAAGQAACASLDIRANVATAADLVRHAADGGADLLVLPELFLTGYELPAIVADPGAYALAPDDSRLDPLAAVCAGTRTAVVVGAPARDPESGNLHISALVLGHDGRYAGRYDKQHVDAIEREAGFSPGRGGCTVVLNDWRLGLGICWDSSFPEHSCAAALDGCHAYLIGAMFSASRGAHKRDTVCPARALDHAMYVVVANHIGPSGPYTGCGGSAIWDPRASCSPTRGMQILALLLPGWMERFSLALEFRTLSSWILRFMPQCGVAATSFWIDLLRTVAAAFRVGNLTPSPIRIAACSRDPRAGR